MNDTKPQSDHDVIILGAGPAGTSTAIRLAALGFNVGIIEHLRFPRPHVGICLSNLTLALLEHLVPPESLGETKHWPRNVTAVKWGTPEANYVHQPGLHVDRGTLDQSMLRKAGTDGVTVYQPASLIHTRLTGAGGWHVAIDLSGARKELYASFVVDATGRKPAMPDRRRRDGPPLMALHANWELNTPLEFDGLIEAGDDAWLWYAQTEPRQGVVSVFCAPRTIRTHSRQTLPECYVQLLQQFQMLDSYRLGQLLSQPQACDASSRHSTNPVGDNFIRVGDACLSVDPLSSQGVHLALLSGIQAAVIINSILRKPDNAELAKRFYRSRVAERVALHADRTRIEYARVSAVRLESFWHERADNPKDFASKAMPVPVIPPSPLPHTRIIKSPEILFALEPVIEGDYVEQRMVVKLPGGEGSIAFVEGVNLESLLAALPQELTYDEVLSHWRNLAPSSLVEKLRLWLWNKRILVIKNEFA